ncbi:MAG: transcription elongation factor GreA [Candidatus Omnitrophota bacterium]
MSDKILMTREGFEKLRKELELMKTVKRRQIADDIAKARAFGDLRENAEYDAAKNSQALNEKRIANAEEKIVHVEILDDSKIPDDQVFIGATVTMKDLKLQEDVIYKIVPQDEADFDQGKISIASPIAKALLGHKVGDIVDIRIPAGILKYRIDIITRV